MGVYIIAEIGPNHNGNLENALLMIKELSHIGVDAVKFQLSIPASLYSADSFKANYQKRNGTDDSPLEMSKRNQLSFDDHKKLYLRCNELGVDYLCTAFDIESLTFLDQNFDLRFFKIASGEIFSVDLIRFISKKNKPVLLSTGMASFSEIGTSLNLLNKPFSKEIILLHCVTDYPARYKDVNLNVLKELKRRFNCPVGFSDHTIGNECAIGAAVLGACVIEKHVTLDKGMEGPDHKASSTVEEFADLVKCIRNVEIAMGYPQKNMSDREKEIARAVRKSLVSTRVLMPGERIRESDLCFKRPGTGLLPTEKDLIIGKKVKAKVEKDRVIARDIVEWQ